MSVCIALARVALASTGAATFSPAIDYQHDHLDVPTCIRFLRNGCPLVPPQDARRWSEGVREGQGSDVKYPWMPHYWLYGI